MLWAAGRAFEIAEEIVIWKQEEVSYTEQSSLGRGWRWRDRTILEARISANVGAM